ncbi:protein mono-ADP-ribosyltransferase PARP4-like isoform X2 [Brachyhypopomus gauderio]|uniref:protein mono-ADP-ribosyltransferase PARP4-like isoform X2 n=1 Tax=Brachyhypopomus gauderio TaxID=698409 RepID=UPI004042FE36
MLWTRMWSSARSCKLKASHRHTPSPPRLRLWPPAVCSRWAGWQLLLEERLSSSLVSRDVGVFLELIWTEAMGSLSSLLTVPVTSISLNDVSRVEGLLLQMQKCDGEDEIQPLLEEVNTLLPLRRREPEPKTKLVSQRLDLCQLIRDILNVSEAALGDPSPSSLGKYRALRCNIEHVPTESREFQSVCKLLQDRPVQVQQVLRVSRASELHMFREELGNIKPLLHSTTPSNFVGILSRGLLLPLVGVEHHGIDRTDVGNLGSGIYFSDSMTTSVKYSRPSVADGSRLLLVCEVALGQCKDLYERDTSLTCAPDGHSSVHAVRRSHSTRTDFEDDEYVVYNTNQVRLKYVVQYFLKEDQVKTFEPHVDTSTECLPPVSTSDILSGDDAEGLEVVKTPLEKVTPGLLDSSGSTLPLEAVHVRAKLMDLLCQVVILQVYTNKSEVPIEAKYVFPLEETAAVCGFEAFINGKHVIGQVKEKEQARKEYKRAIEKGHGAYLMDQEAADVFTISVGNLPAGATVLIKVTYITELVVRAGTLLFSLPTSVAPWQQSAALNQRTQTSVEKVGVNELRPEGEFSLHMSIEMPYKITDLECSHSVKTKRTDCKVVVMTLPDQSLGDDGFQLSFSLCEIHMPRMWVEKHPEKDSEACMLVFYPDFECSGVRGSAASDVVIILDTSESMRGEAMLNARRLALQALRTLDRSTRVNVVCFGTDYKEAFPSPRVLEEVFEPAKKFIMSTAAVGGSTELWRPLRSLNLLPPSRGLRNVLLLSDGHVQNQPETLQLVRDNACHTRLFTCGLSPTANRHMLRLLAQTGGGVYEYFDTKKKHTWAEKVNSQVRCMASPGCRSVSVKWQRFNPTAPPPVQAPSQLHTLFNNRHTLVYGFVPRCTQATLFGDLSGQEIQTMVSTTELQKTKGTFLHKLTARAIIRDYEDGSLDTSEAEHEGRKAALKSYIIELSKEFSILSQFTSFVAIEERDQDQPESRFTSIPDLIAKEDGSVDILPYMGWAEDAEEWEESVSHNDIDYCTAFECEPQLDYYGYNAMEFREETLVDECYDDVMMLVEESCVVAPPPSVDPPPPSRPSRSEQTLHYCSLPSPTTDDSDIYELESHSEEEEEDESPSPVPSPDCSVLEPQSWMFPKSADSFTNLLSRLHESQVTGQSAEVSHHHAISLDAAPPSSSFGRTARRGYLCFSEEPEMLMDRGGDLLARVQSAPRESSSVGADALFSTVHSESDAHLQHGPSPDFMMPRIGSVFHAPPLFGKRAKMPVIGAMSYNLTPRAACFDIPPSHRPPPPSMSAVAFGSAPHAPPPIAPTPPAYQPMLIGSMAAPPGLLGSRSYLMPPLPPPMVPGVIVSAPHAPPPLTPQLMPLAEQRAGMSLCYQATPPVDFTLPSFPIPPPPPITAAGFAPLGPAPPAPQTTPPRPQDSPSPVSAAGAICFASSGPPRTHSNAQVSHTSAVPLDLRHAERQGDEGLARRSFAISFSSQRGIQKATENLNVKRHRKNLHEQPDRINWEELFDLQHQDGYWDCTGRLSRFLGLDVEFFANVFLKEKGICSLGVTVHTAILRLVATLLVLQLLRVKMMSGAFFDTLLHLRDVPEPRPAHWEAVERAVCWARRADRQNPCVCTRLELGWDWESCTRQLLRLDTAPPNSALLPVLQRSVGLAGL